MTSLRDVYNAHVLIDPEVQRVYNIITNRVIHSVVDGIKSNDDLLRDLYSCIYFTGSRWDGLQVGTDRQECDVNICFDVQTQAKLKFCEDIASPSRPNFAYICVEGEPNDDLEEICDEDYELGWIVSPVLLFRKMWIAGEAYFNSIDNILEIEVDDEVHRFEVQTQISSTPWTLTLKNENFSKIEIDLVPAIVVHADMMPKNLKQKIKRIMNRTESKSSKPNLEDQGVLAIALKTDSYRFEVDCHELERKLLFNKGQAKMVVRMIKYFRNVRKGPLEKLTSHMIKTVVMHKILTVGDDDYWNNFDKAFEECTELLIRSIKKRQIFDVIFKSFNILTNKIKDEAYLDNMDKALENIQHLLHDSDNIDTLFAIGACSFCNQIFINSDRTCDEKSLKKHLAQEHDIRTWCSGGVTCTCTKDSNEMEVCIRSLGQCSPEDREKDYHCNLCDKIFACHDRLVQHVRNVHNKHAMLKNALCNHCQRRMMTKCGLYNHIWIKHPEFREAAELALMDKDHEQLVVSLKEEFD